MQMVDKNKKNFWTYIKQQRKDCVGTSPLKEIGSGDLVTDSRDKAKVLNQQFKSVFTMTVSGHTIRGS